MHGIFRTGFVQLAAGAICALHPAACPAHGADRAVVPERPNVLLIVIDTLRADRLGCYGYERATSPTLDALARQAVVYDRSYSYSDGTIYSHLALFSSQHVQRIARGGPSGKMLAEVFAENGYHTYGLSANPTLLPTRGFDRGFDYFTHCPVSRELVSRAISGSKFNQQTETRSAEETTKALLKKLREHHDRDPDEPWFAFVNYLDPHDPYTERKPWSDEFRESASTISGSLRSGGSASIWKWVAKTLPTLSADDIKRLGELYDAEIRYTDEHIARVLSYLDEAGWRNHTVVVVTSDHGEVLGEPDHMFTHMLACYEAELAVPLIVHAPWFESRCVRADDLVETVDLAPTLLTMCGIEPPKEFVGRTILTPAGRPLATRRTFTRHYHWAISADERRKLSFPREGLHNAIVVRSGGKKLYIPRSGGKPRLFDVLAYPLRVEIHNPRAVRRMLDLAGIAPERNEAEPTTQPTDPELLRALRSLGYVE